MELQFPYSGLNYNSYNYNIIGRICLHLKWHIFFSPAVEGEDTLAIRLLNGTGFAISILQKSLENETRVVAFKIITEAFYSKQYLSIWLLVTKHVPLVPISRDSMAYILLNSQSKLGTIIANGFEYLE